jgi:hypothetical protein
MNKTHTIEDGSGNRLIATHNDSIINLSLLLIDGKKRAIGQIDKGTRTLRLIRSRSKHLMRVNNSYGINYYLIENGKAFDKVQIVDEQNSWLVTKEYLIENCTTMNFKAQGFELQKLISLDKLNSFVISQL